jgi:hypothetical protein
VLRSFAVVAVATLLVCGCGGEEASPDVVAKAKQAYADAKARGVDMSTGPCLGIVAPDWVADVAHDPREDVDDDPANQCAEYRDGTAHHFVELDPNGRLIRSS